MGITSFDKILDPGLNRYNMHFVLVFETSKQLCGQFNDAVGCHYYTAIILHSHKVLYVSLGKIFSRFVKCTNNALFISS